MENKEIYGKGNMENTDNEEYVYVSSGRSDVKLAEKTEATVSAEKTDVNENDLVNIDVVEDLMEVRKNRYADNKSYKKNNKNNKESFFTKHKLPLIITGTAVAAVAVVGVVLWQLCANGILPNPFAETVGSIENEYGEFTYLSGLSISGIDISGKTYEQAKALLEEHTADFVNPFQLTVKANDKDYKFTQKDFAYTYNIDEVLDKAKKYCQDVSDGIIKPTQPETDSNGKTADLFEVTAVIKDESVKAAAEKVAEQTDVDAKNASVSKFSPFAKERFEYADGSKGLKTNKEELVSSIKAFIGTGKENGIVSAKVETTEPEITKDMVKKNIVPLSYFTTTSVNTANAT
ncbi:MAG: hypothetical protein PUD24_05750, partial [Oscillospiraceae bacterium]|nr:hypothetical protein [Oscillospiraceae bacterium]